MITSRNARSKVLKGTTREDYISIPKQVKPDKFNSSKQESESEKEGGEIIRGYEIALPLIRL